jgi:pyruvate dehydrogenase E2 component (dihydrolipoamide acetyltransferase)
MPTELVMPQMGYDMKEGKVVKWLRNEGDQVVKGETIAEIETDKATIEMESFTTGILRRIVVPEGETVPVGQVIAYVGSADEAIPSLPPRTAAGAPRSPAPSPASPTLPSHTPAPGATSGTLRVSPIARQLAQEAGIDLSRLTGTGPQGRIVEADVRAFLASRSPAPPAAPITRQPVPVPAAPPTTVPVGEQVVELSRMRQAIARLTTRAKQEIPHYYVASEINMSEPMDLRRKLNEALEPQGVRVTVNDLIIKACAIALQKYPDINASFKDGRLVRHGAINIGIAVALEDGGLIVPAILDCAHKSLPDIAKAAKDLIDRAHAQRLREQEYTAATFSISNLGALEVDSFSAIIHPPQSHVLAIGAVRKRPVIKDDQIAIGQTMIATLSADHRVTSGADAARYLTEVRRLLESPLLLLV